MAFSPDPENTALIVVDVQNDACHENGALAKLGRSVATIQPVVPKIAELISSARKASVPVIFVITHHDPFTDSLAWRSRQIYEEDKIICLTGSWGAESYQIDRKDADYVIVKNRYSGFHETNLNLVLNTLGRRKLLFCGFTTNVCVETTLRDATSRDFIAALVSDCAAAFTPEEHQNSMINIERYFGSLTTLQEVKQFWGLGN